MIDDILKYARMNKELAGVDEDSLESSSELKKLVQAQAAELELLKQRVSAWWERRKQWSGGCGAGGGVCADATIVRSVHTLGDMIVQKCLHCSLFAVPELTNVPGFTYPRRVLSLQIMAGGGGQFIGINGSPHRQAGGGDGSDQGGAGGDGSVYSTGSGGYSYMMQPLGGDGPDSGPFNRVSR